MKYRLYSKQKTDHSFQGNHTATSEGLLMKNQIVMFTYSLFKQAELILEQHLHCQNLTPDATGESRQHSACFNGHCAVSGVDTVLINKSQEKT